MNLKKFKEKNPKRNFIIIFTACSIVLLAGVYLYTSFAIFTEDKQFNVINGQYQDPGDLYFTVYINGQITNTFPSKEDGYVFDTTQSSCTNGATVSWDNDSWSALVNFTNYNVENISRTKCTMYFKEQSFVDAILACNDTAANCLVQNASLNTVELAYDETVDNNLRYIGADPNNYVSFNNELWRIIGVMNNIDDGSGKKETRLKIIRAESIGTYSWDNKASGVGSSTSLSGSNDWSDSALQIVLNSGAYFNRTTGECPHGVSGATIACDFSSNGLSDEAKTMIGNTLWNLGGTETYSSSSNGLASHWYTYERGKTVYSDRPTEWIGRIGLMYPSDYGYATSGGSTTNRETCLNTALYSWGNSSYRDCKNKDWLYNSSYTPWTLTSNSSSVYNVFVFDTTGYVTVYGAYNTYNAVYPALYLTSNVKISGGEGTSSNPYTLTVS